MHANEIVVHHFRELPSNENHSKYFNKARFVYGPGHNKKPFWDSISRFLLFQIQTREFKHFTFGLKINQLIETIIKHP